MLDYLYKYDISEINKLVTNEEFPYLNFSSYKNFELFTKEPTEWNEIQKVSINSEGKILGVFEASISRNNNRVSGLCLCKFKSTFSEDDYDIAREDLKLFMQDLVNLKGFTIIQWLSIVDNPATKLYDSWVERYGGNRQLIPKYTRLKDGYFDVYSYYIKCRDFEGVE